MWQLTERVLAVGAVVGFDPQVDAQVLGQVGGVGECLGAVGTLVGFGLRVRLWVNLHLRLGEEGERAHFASSLKKRKEKKKTKQNTNIKHKSFSLLFVMTSLAELHKLRSACVIYFSLHRELIKSGGWQLDHLDTDVISAPENIRFSSKSSVKSADGEVCKFLMSDNDMGVSKKFPLSGSGEWQMKNNVFKSKSISKKLTLHPFKGRIKYFSWFCRTVLHPVMH